MNETKQLNVIDAHELMERDLPPPRFCVDTLLPQGLTILGGAPKVGKSWLVLDLSVHIAKGEAIWNLPTRQSGVLYLCLEDSEKRVQQRLLSITDEVPQERLFLATQAGKLADALCTQIREQVRLHPDIALVIVDTFQMVRGGADVTYANDYENVQRMKALSDDLGIALLLVHHLRKRGDSDELNKLSGTTGLSGAADAVLILDRSDRMREEAKLTCTGRDIEARELQLRFNRGECVWELLRDSLEQRSLPAELSALVSLLQQRGAFSGSNTALAAEVSAVIGQSVPAKGLKQLMNQWRGQLEREGIHFRSHRSNGERLVEVAFSSALSSAASDASDAKTPPGASCDPCDPCVPVLTETRPSA